MTTVRELDNLQQLPTSERHVTISGPTCLAEALALIRSRYAANRLNLERVYFSRSDHRYWFILKGKK